MTKMKGITFKAPVFVQPMDTTIDSGRIKPITAGYFLALEELGGWFDGYKPFYRWIEHTAVAFTILDMFMVEIVSPMGSIKMLSPYIFFGMDRKEMMKQKRTLNNEIVRKDEPEKLYAWSMS